ncbi:MAG: class I SAM-dependent methyltransferase [Sulfurovum sp.]|nr:class I SAM-dependent methyltransferase [Sulfurovum sp.]
MSKINPKLENVPETMLWTLHNRATEAMREDGIIEDEKCIEIFKAIDYDYVKSFGKAEPSHAVRSLDFDREIRSFLEEYPDGIIINLGEGLETQRFRFDDEALWISVDLPESIKIREQFIESDERHLHIALSATDKSWFDKVPKDKAIFVSAQGLFMYFHEEDVRILLQDIVNTFEQGYIMFDTIPRLFSQTTTSKKGWKKTPHYTVPKMPWGINKSKIEKTFKDWLGKKVKVYDIGYSTFPRGVSGWFFSFLSSVPILRNITPSIVKIEF